MAVTRDPLAEQFTAHRAHLLSVVYRLTGSVTDAEDVVQEAWLRLAGLSEAQRDEIRDLRGWLTTVAGRLGLDRLRSAAVRRERYVGQWLPEPIMAGFGPRPSEDPLDVAVRDDGVRMAAMVVLDRLTPEQRVAFVLHDAFSVPFAEIAEILGCTTATARQHASRGRRALAEADPPPRVPMAEQQALLERLLTALNAGDVRAIAEVLHPDVVLIGDADGKARTSRRVMAGADKITRFLAGLLRMYTGSALTGGRPVLVNGDLGLYLPAAPGDEDHVALDPHVTTVAVRDGRIVAIYDVANPDKLTRLPD